MIIDRLKYIKNTLPVKLREARIVQLIHVLISKIKELHDEINDYTLKARLYASCTSQVCWMEYMLRSELGDDSITITEGNGLPVDFIVTGISYDDRIIAMGLLNKFKMAGRSYILDYPDIEIYAAWSDAFCVRTNVFECSAAFSDPVCAKEEEVVVEPTQIVNYQLGWVGSIGSDNGFYGTISLWDGAILIQENDMLTTLAAAGSFTIDGDNYTIKTDLNGRVDGNNCMVYLKYSVNNEGFTDWLPAIIEIPVSSGMQNLVIEVSEV